MKPPSYSIANWFIASFHSLACGHGGNVAQRQPGEFAGGVVAGEVAPCLDDLAQPALQLDILPGHMPSPGTCRIWMPGVPPGQQSPPGNCNLLRRQVPPGGVLVAG